jgi:hypothetical protein
MFSGRRVFNHLLSNKVIWSLFGELLVAELENYQTFKKRF